MTPPPLRRYPRVTLRGSAQVNSQDWNAGPPSQGGELCMLSQGGALVVGLGPLAIGAVVRMHLMFPQQIVPVDVHAKVLYVLPKDRGTGFAFVDPRGEIRERIAQVVEKIDLLQMQILFCLTSESVDEDYMRALCLEAGLPHDLPSTELKERVLAELKRSRA